ncbi:MULTISPECIES: hypothetical protein [unclassified Campylobacter]|uniref:hypothetical protein n=1 Tax=unclassified Campylobacter TaxID=2593542 RepID=UPI001237C4EB|nr:MULTISPECIES: hypothetical protein [unclassified Campylobacter]KAA6227157.1 hypothetical protein FMM54_03185 [Campylobacter sp. LR185c]KAA6227446.1 hypothetical protein FMM55_02595 [Campylobacter sp. LR196d]KAA6228473.1 hypothetical protein FMM57_02600 [Campylobacter sp. LR286c]KAA8603781.1 hypothetical protein CGP82_05135 [Campylobacter sp. LR185c]
MRLALCLFGHLRTYKQTYQSLFKNIVKTNLNDNWEIDIFLHSWDEFEKSGFAWYNGEEIFKGLNGKVLSNEDKEELCKIYNPKSYLIEHLNEDKGMFLSIKKVQILALEYAKEKLINYDYTLLTRPDIYFDTPLRLNTYIKFYENKAIRNHPLPQKHIFVANNYFHRMPVSDPRCFCEGDLLWFGSFNPLFVPYSQMHKIPVIGIDYKFNRDFFLQRSEFRLGWLSSERAMLKLANDENARLKALLAGENSNFVLIKNDDINKTKNHLAYKLGSVILEYKKGLISMLKMFFVLSYIKQKHDKEQILSQKRLENSPNLALAFNDKKTNELAKNDIRYKIGTAFIKAYKSPFKLGLFRFFIKDLKKME